MDEVDRRILQRLVTDGRATLQEISDAVGLRRPSVHERVKKLQEQGVLRGFRADVDPAALDGGLVAFVFIEIALETQGKQDCLACCEDLSGRLRRHPEILECHTLAGSEDMMVKVRAKDLPHVERLVMRDISGLPGVRRVQTKIALRTHFERVLHVPIVRPQEKARSRRPHP